jgi:ribonuclease HI
MERRHVDIFTDGSCIQGPRNKKFIDGAGGWAAVLYYGNESLNLYGGEYKTTNNRMELTAVIKALEALQESCDVTLMSDSEYVLIGITHVEGWKERDWVNKRGCPVSNRDLWEQLLPLLKKHVVHTKWIRGHSGIPGNEICDSLASTMSKRIMQEHM